MYFRTFQDIPERSPSLSAIAIFNRLLLSSCSSDMPSALRVNYKLIEDATDWREFIGDLRNWNAADARLTNANDTTVLCPVYVGSWSFSSSGARTRGNTS
jgi:hypothetical protein